MPTSVPLERPLKAVPFTRVSLDDAFWSPRIETNRRVTLPIEYRQCQETGRLDAWEWKQGQPHEPHIFWDSDVAKWIEAAAYSLMTHPDPDLEARIDRVVERMVRCQAPDGYLNSHYQRVEPSKRWTNLRDGHELYCAGHLMEAAVALEAATGKRTLLDALCRYADCIDQEFGRSKGKKRGYCGHPEIELALVKLARSTGERRYLRLAKYFVDERGRRPAYFSREAVARQEDPARSYIGPDGSYVQAHRPVREQREVVGHAVRAMYLYSGMADVAAETGDTTLLSALEALWRNVTERRMHVTGGLGPTSRNEGFTFDYDLPNETAYDETCANIALVFWAHRMFHLDPDGRYVDVMERALYNGVISGVSLSGDRFFYANPLAAHPGVDPHGKHSDPDFRYLRSEWFGCACCPPNIARLLASFSGYVYSEGPDEARIHLYAAGEATLDVGGRRVVLRQRTRYPWDGRVDVAVGLSEPARLAIALRIPGWCRGAKLAVNGRPVAVKPLKGYARIERLWKSGDRIRLTLPMPVERIEAHPRVRQDAGRVALQRGPVVYCLEEVDNGTELNDVLLSRTSRLVPKWDATLLGGVVVLKGRALRRDRGAWKAAELYRNRPTRLRSMPIQAIPYAVWNNRMAGEMVVWIRDSSETPSRR